MAINIFEIQPSTVSRDLSGKSFLIYGKLLPFYNKGYKVVEL